MKSRSKWNLAAVFVLLFLLYGCSSVSQQQAEGIAGNFVRENVRFFAREQNTTTGFDTYAIESVSSYQEKNNWVVIMHIAAPFGNQTKKNDMTVTINSKGEVIAFNGKRIENKNT